ncbi:MAG TPA: hypothetical protein VHG72_02475 [Polyangia bacterium]|nr:hypothetical protein [Polyangia bacterium]
MALDHALFGRQPVPYHVHTLLWYAALLAVVAALYRRAASRSLALLALFIFCLDDGHVLSIAFIAGRHSVISCALVWLAKAEFVSLAEVATPEGLTKLGACLQALEPAVATEVAATLRESAFPISRTEIVPI